MGTVILWSEFWIMNPSSWFLFLSFHSSLSPSWKWLLAKSSIKVPNSHTACLLSSSFSCSWFSSAKPCPRCSAGLFPLAQRAHWLPIAAFRIGRTWGLPAYYDCHGPLLNSFIISLWIQQHYFLLIKQQLLFSLTKLFNSTCPKAFSQCWSKCSVIANSLSNADLVTLSHVGGANFTG